MKKQHIRILAVIIVVAALGTAFPTIKKFSEIRSETRKWTEKWVDRPEATSVEHQASLLRASKVPESIEQNQSLSLAQSPWRIDSHVIIQEGVTLSIEPGVEIFIGPKADIQVYGRILALGEQNRRVHLRAYTNSETDAWAGIFIRSDEKSEFKHVEFENSKYGARLVFSSATWEHCSFRNVREICSGYKSDLSFETCLFDYRNFSGGGNINVMKFYQGVFQVENSDFFTPDSDYKVDGIDADYVTRAVIRGNRFFGGQCENSDAIDIGHGSRDIVVENNLIVDFIDKGVSVGEKAEAKVCNNVIVGCAIGVGVKDSARVTITRTTFYKNDYAIRSYEKIAGKGGGYAKVDQSIIVLSRKAPVEADELSSIEISNSLCDSTTLKGNNNLQGTPTFKDVEQYNFNVTSIQSTSRQQTSLSPSPFGAKL